MVSEGDAVYLKEEDGHPHAVLAPEETVERQADVHTEELARHLDCEDLRRRIGSRIALSDAPISFPTPIETEQEAVRDAVWAEVGDTVATPVRLVILTTSGA